MREIPAANWTTLYEPFVKTFFDSKFDKDAYSLFENWYNTLPTTLDKKYKAELLFTVGNEFTRATEPILKKSGKFDDREISYWMYAFMASMKMIKEEKFAGIVKELGYAVSSGQPTTGGKRPLPDFQKLVT